MKFPSRPEGDAFGFENLTVEERLRRVLDFMQKATRLPELDGHQFFTLAPLFPVGIDRDPAQVFYELEGLEPEELFLTFVPDPARVIAGLGSEELERLLQAVVKERWEDLKDFILHQGFVDRRKGNYWEIELQEVKILDPLSQTKPGTMVLEYTLPVFLPSGNRERYVVKESTVTPATLWLTKTAPDPKVVKRGEKELGYAN